MLQLLIWIIIWVISRWLTRVVMKGRGYGLVGDLIIRLLGGVWWGVAF